MFKPYPLVLIVCVVSAHGACHVASPPITFTTAPPGACQRADLRARSIHENGSDLFGVALGWDMHELFTAVSLRGAARGDHPLTLRQDGEALKARDGAGAESKDLSGVTLLGLRPSGGTVHLALCAPGAGARHGYRYRLEVYNESSSVWEDACSRDKNVKDPLAYALTGVWDVSTGAHRAAADRFTISCETGVVGKCVKWGYDPAGPARGGASMRDAHQACTRMARADYCGNGTPHTEAGMGIDIEDNLGVQRYDSPGALELEATWGPAGATCVSFQRNGAALADLRAECPERLASGALTLREYGSCEEPMTRGAPRAREETRGDAGAAGAVLRNRARRP